MKWISFLFCLLSLTTQASTLHLNLNHKLMTKQGLKLDNLIQYARKISNKPKVKLKLIDIRESLTGMHYLFGQENSKRLIRGSEISLTVNAQGIITRVIDNLSSKKVQEMEPLVSQAQAIKTSWVALGATDDFIFMPKAKLRYIDSKKGIRLAYVVAISVSEPYGHWLVSVDAQNSEVLGIEEQSNPTKTRELHLEEHKAKSFHALSFEEALENFNNKKLKKMTQLIEEERTIDGQAQVFDPSPNTTLMDDSLRSDSSLDLFEDAYRLVGLDHLTATRSGFELRNSDLKLTDFDRPKNTVSTSKSGSWIFKRNQRESFLDAMTYYHLNRSLNHLKDLGFVGSKKVFKEVLKVDSNGANGKDNSYFNTTNNALSFGHGCVPDNEDSDVILHELGHAIQHNIVKNFRGGDAGAMGEGFGDYWASSYRLSTENGMNFHPERVFIWDGHNHCWPGRMNNRTNIHYHHNKHYHAHSKVEGGVSDELWSTPLVQTFKELYQKGVERSVMDKIIIESHFGLSSGVKMREMAQIIVDTAKKLYPNEKYYQVYQKHFKVNRILE